MAPLTVMGSVADVRKLRASLGLLRKVTLLTDSRLVQQIDESLSVRD